MHNQHIGFFQRSGMESELPRAYARGILEFKLRLPVVFLSLMLNVFAYHSLRYPHRRYKIPIRPYPTHTPIHFSQKFKLSLNAFAVFDLITPTTLLTAIFGGIETNKWA